jgi:D-amino-acid oxidase
MSDPKKVVVVLGSVVYTFALLLHLLTYCSAGVNGLTAALSLLEAGYAVKIIAKHLPGDLDPNYPSEMRVYISIYNNARRLFQRIHGQ